MKVRLEGLNPPEWNRGDNGPRIVRDEHKEWAKLREVGQVSPSPVSPEELKFQGEFKPMDMVKILTLEEVNALNRMFPKTDPLSRVKAYRLGEMRKVWLGGYVDTKG